MNHKPEAQEATGLCQCRKRSVSLKQICIHRTRGGKVGAQGPPWFQKLFQMPPSKLFLLFLLILPPFY